MEDGLTSLDRAKDADARRRLDELDYNDAISGQDSGRMGRFGGMSRKRDEQEKKKAEKAFRDALEQLLQDPEYRALYEELGSRLASAEIEADTVIADLEATLQDLDAQIADMEARAAKGPDGNPVFKLDDGRVVDTSGEDLPPEIADGIIWPPNAPSGDDYFDIKTRRSDNADLLTRWLDYRHDTLGGIRDRYDDRENPQVIDGLRGDLDAIEAIRPSEFSLQPAAPKDVTAALPNPTAFPTIGGMGN